MPAPPRKDLSDPAAPPGRDRSLPPGSASAVERSLEDFIARANTTLPLPGAEAAAAVRAIGSRATPRKANAHKKKGPATLVVLGPQAPLAEVTEIVSRLPAAGLDAPRRRPLAAWALGLAFLAGAVAVLVATRFLAAAPTPIKPTVPAARVIPPPPPIVIVPIPEPLPSAPAAPPALSPDVTASPPAVRPPRKSTATRASAKPTPPKKASGLVDPFAD